MEFHDVVFVVVQLNLFGSEWRFMVGFVVFGIVIVVICRYVWVLCLVFCSLVMFLFASNIVFYEFRLFDVLSFLVSIQY